MNHKLTLLEISRMQGFDPQTLLHLSRLAEMRWPDGAVSASFSYSFGHVECRMVVNTTFGITIDEYAFKLEDLNPKIHVHKVEWSPISKLDFTISFEFE